MSKAEAKFVFISAAEPSADRHAASLITAVHALRPEIQFVGVAGPRMREAGCECVFDMSAHAAMLSGVFGALGHARRMMATCRDVLKRRRFAAAVLLDSPVLHLPLSKHLRKSGVPVLYYIAPQLWAWGAGRIRRIRRWVNKLAVILPFEQEWFQNRGVDAVFVGHPLADQLDQPDEAVVRNFRSQGAPVLALLPGSREHVVRVHAPDLLAMAALLRPQFPNIRVLISAANEKSVRLIQHAVSSDNHTTTMVEGSPTSMIEAADLVLVVSGTMTLETAFRAKPMIVLYRASPWFYHLIARWMIKTPFLALPNILAGELVVPECMPRYCVPDVAALAGKLLRDDNSRVAMSQRLTELTRALRGPGAAENTAKLLLTLVENPT